MKKSKKLKKFKDYVKEAPTNSVDAGMVAGIRPGEMPPGNKFIITKTKDIDRRKLKAVTILNKRNGGGQASAY